MSALTVAVAEGSITPLEYNNGMVPHEFTSRVFGPWGHAAPAGFGFALGTTDFVLPMTFDRDGVIDKVSVKVEVKAAAARTIRLVYVLDGQTLAAAITASQFLTSSLDLNTLTNATWADMTITTTVNALPAKFTIGVDLASTSDTALVGLMLFIRHRTMIR